ncbi:DUF1534 domain-containing protein [Pseudomonas tremae]|nr:DUF1534 domain-containing protein [Pseudomonas tremae]
MPAAVCGRGRCSGARFIVPVLQRGNAVRDALRHMLDAYRSGP